MMLVEWGARWRYGLSRKDGIAVPRLTKSRAHNNNKEVSGMISQKMNEALNHQVTNEMLASFKYLAMAFQYNDMGLLIFGKRFRQQSDEERGHALKIAEFIQDVGGKISIEAIAKPKSGYPTAISMVEAALESERTVTKQINDLVDMAFSEKDHATQSFLKWFVDEQVEEEKSMNDLLAIMKVAGDQNLILVENRLAAMMDKEGDEDEDSDD
jgi:ferritin